MPSPIDELKTSNGLRRTQSTSFIRSKPTSSRKPKKENNNFAVSIQRHHLSSIPESQEVVPLRTSPKIASLLRELIIYTFQLRDSSKKTSKYVNDWVSNVQPQIAPSNMRANFLEMKNSLEQLPKEGIEKVLETTSRMLRASTDKNLQMTQSLKDLKEKEIYKEEAASRFDRF